MNRVRVAALTWPVMLVCLLGCASRAERYSGESALAAPPPAAAEPALSTYEIAQPMELEPRSYIAGQRDHYNRVYARPESERPAPNEFLLHSLKLIEAQRQHEQDAPSGASPTDSIERTALDVAMGDGRNTIALAQHGYRTSGFDMSDVGVNRARRRAAEVGLTIDAQVSFYDERYLAPNQWDVVAMMYFGVDDNTMRKIKDSIKPGGYIILEYSTSGDSNKLLHDFFDWHIVHYERSLGIVEWRSREPVREESLRGRLLARRPMPGTK